LAYLAMASSAAAQTPTTTSVSTSPQTTTQASGSSGWPSPRQSNWQGGGTQFQWGGPPPGQWNQQGSWSGQGQSEVSLSTGQTITFTSTSGEYRTMGTSSTNGTASGAITFEVTGKLSQGHTLAMASGSLTLAGTTYSMGSGTAQMDPFGTTMSGQGTTSPSGSFILHASAHGTFVATSTSVSLDFTNGTTEYLILLTGST